MGDRAGLIHDNPAMLIAVSGRAARSSRAGINASTAASSERIGAAVYRWCPSRWCGSRTG